MTARPEALRVARRWIARYAVEARYPIGEEPLTGDEARSAIALSRRVRAAVLQAVSPGSPAA
jgi:hypothetical protein